MSAAGLSDQVILAAIPLIACARSGVNVMSDMFVAILLDIGKTRPTREIHAESGR